MAKDDGAMRSLRGFGEWLRDAAKLPWGELAQQGIDMTEATAELAEPWKDAAPKLAQLKNLDKVDSFFEVFDSPVAKLAVGGLPFLSVGVELLRIYCAVTKTEPTFESSVAIAAQMAYLESLQAVLMRADEHTQAVLEKVRLSELFERQMKKSELIELTRTKTQPRKTLTQLRKSDLGEVFDKALGELLTAAGLGSWQVNLLVDQTAWGTPKYFHSVVADLKDEVKPLAEFLQTNGLRIQEKFDSIESYLSKEIEPLPRQQVFDEAKPLVTFSDLYVQLTVQPLKIDGKTANEGAMGIHAWAENLLTSEEPRKVGFIEGEAGRGKSVFCRMLAEMVRLELYPAFIPILIRLRDVRVLENNLTQTLETHLQYLDFVRSDSGWLTDLNTRFLLIFDGFDELLLQGREGGGLKELVQQLGDFQARTHHQCLVTGRPLALQGVDRMLSQTHNLVRVRLEPMTAAQRNEWLGNWAKLFGEEEANNFEAFLTACPSDIGEQLAREPLLLYLLGRLHRENHLNAQMFAGTGGMQAKVRVYDQSVKWVLERQRQEVSEQIPGLAAEDLRQVLQEAALCVVQSGNETAKLTMLKSRFTDDANPVAELLKQAQSEIQKSEDKTLNNLLTAFYLKPGEGDKTGSVEFAHKSFGEFLFAERLKAAFDNWVELDRRSRPRLSETEIARQIYDLLGYGFLTPEVVEYLKELLFPQMPLPELVRLFQQLQSFYSDWCDGVYIDKATGENLPQVKVAQMDQVEIPLGLRQVDIYAGLNVMILLFQLHHYGQQGNVQTESLKFRPCADLKVSADQTQTDGVDSSKLLRIIGYSQIIGIYIWRDTVGRYLSGADLSGVELVGVNLRGAKFSDADLSRANLSSANLRGADLSGANLRVADLSSADLSSADLRGADLSSADLRGADLSSANFSGADLSGTNLSGANLSRANLSGVNLSSANLSSANLSVANLSSANLRVANLSGANLSSANLSSANLSSADLSSANLSSADLSSADLFVANLSSADLFVANLSGANLSVARLRDANLSGANLIGTSLRDADLIGTNLRDANLSGANLRGANLIGTNLRDANLSGANLRGADLSNANLDRIHCIKTDWDGARGLATARNLPNALIQKLDLGH
jgi:uncharacterized protein YjbI with pentapeptide repeats